VLVDRPALERAEGLMKASGLFNTDQIRPVIEARMWARWRRCPCIIAVTSGLSRAENSRLIRRSRALGQCGR